VDHFRQRKFLATVSLDDVYIPVDAAHFFDRTTAGINYPYIFPTAVAPNRTHPQDHQPQRSDGESVSLHSTGPIYTGPTVSRDRNHTLKFGMYYEKSGGSDSDEINVPPVPLARTIRTGSSVHRHPRQ
jgi:hypothetical protein